MDKYKDLSSEKYRKEFTPNITFQPNKVFVRDDLFEKIIKNCKATNLEFLKLKVKLGLCIYEEICDEKESILTSEKSFIQRDVENEKLKNENENENEKLETRNEKAETRDEKLEMRNEKVEMTNENNIIKEEPKSLNWFDKNKFKKILAIIDSNEFSYKNKIGKFKYDNIKDLVNNIRNNTVSEIDAKKDLNALKEIRNVEIIKYKKRTPGHKKLIKLFNDLNIILTDKTLKSKNQENENEKVESRKEINEKVESRKEENEKVKNEDEDDYYKYGNEYEYENENEYENEDDDDETMSQDEITKNLNYDLDEIIGKSKSFEEQIKLLKKRRSKMVLTF